MAESAIVDSDVMLLDDDSCYRAMTARDVRFDGQFFTAVSTTGIFCRPICPARLPARSHCVFYPSAAAALDAGYRPCLRCRPEVSPELPAWHGTSAVVSRALRLIHEGGLDEEGASVEHLAARVGLGARHLRRLFDEHLGASPVAVAQARRLLFAKRLLTDTTLPLTEIAAASGFGSVRRFNDLFQRTYSRSPRALRKDAAVDTPIATGPLELKLAYRPPYDWQGIAAFLSARAVTGVESCSAVAGYTRTIVAGGSPGRIHVTPIPGAHALRLRVEMASIGELRAVTERAARMFDLGAQPGPIAARLGAIGRPGVRIPGAWDPFELAVRAILGQQVTVTAATTMAGRIVERWGGTAKGLSGTPNRLFPPASRLARVDVASIGMPAARGEAITNLARVVDSGEFDFTRIGCGDEAVRALCTLRGIGPWTAQYIVMRAFGEPDAFPSGDLVLRQAIGAGATEATVAATAEAWRPWRAYAAFSLWQRSAKVGVKERMS